MHMIVLQMVCFQKLPILEAFEMTLVKPYGFGHVMGIQLLIGHN